MRELTNRDRAQWVRDVLESYPDHDAGEDGVQDLLADMMHYCREEGIDNFDELITFARNNFEAEVWLEDAEEAKHEV